MPLPRSFISSVVVLLITILSTGTFFLPVSTFAQSVEDLRASVDTLNAKIKALDQEIQEFNKKINQTQGETKTLKQALASLELKRSALVTQIQATNLKIEQAESSIVLTQTKISTTKETIDRSHLALAELLRSTNTNQNDVPVLVSLASSKHLMLSSMFEEVKRSQDFSSQMQYRLNDLKEAKVSLEVSKVEYEAQKDSLKKLQASLSDQKYLVDQNSQEKASLLKATQNKESEYQKLLADRKKKKGELEAEVLDYESKIKVAVDASKLPKYGKGVLSFPVDKVVITQYFGTTPFASANPQVYNGSGHNGIDLGVPSGTVVKAAAAGVVIGTGDTDLACTGVSYGRWVLIRHANGLTTLYAHLSKIGVSANQTVQLGEQIGLSGNTGYSTGPHVHFTVYASDSVHVTGPNEYKSKVCGTYMSLPVAPRAGYLNPLSYL